MSVSVDTPQPATVALTGEISFFACIAQQEPATQRTIWEGIRAASCIFQETQETTEAQKIFSDFLSDNGISIAPGYADRLTPEARQLLRANGPDTRTLLNEYAALPSRQQSSLITATYRAASWAKAISTGNASRVTSYAALDSFGDFMDQILHGDLLEDIEEEAMYKPGDMTELQNAWLTIERIETARLARMHNAREINAEFIAVLAEINTMPEARRVVTLTAFLVFGQAIKDGAGWQEAARAAFDAHMNHPLTQENGPLWSWGQFQAIAKGDK